MVHEQLRELARQQHGLLRRAQVLQGGMTEKALQHRMANGYWQRVLPGVYATFSGELTGDQRAHAALLFAGNNAQLSGLSACRQYELRYLPSDDGRVHVLVPHGCHRGSRVFVVIHRTRKLSPPRYVRGLSLSPPARAVIDACRELTSLRDVRALMADATNRRLVQPRQFEFELAAGCSAGSALPRIAMRDVSLGCRSAPECELHDLFKTSSILPAPEWNAPIHDEHDHLLGIADAWLAEARLAVEVNSREWHLDGDTFEATMQRASRFAAAGILVLPVSPSRIRRDGAAVLREIEESYLARVRAAPPVL